MLNKKPIFFLLLMVILAFTSTGLFARKNTTDITQTSSATLDENERTHLVFMREEEKLARDVYTTLSTMYPGSAVFGNIDDSEQKHTDSVKDTLVQYNIDDPNTNDNVGVFTGEDYGWYFTEKYAALVARGAMSELEALYVGAYIEELDMLDINQCPNVIVDTIQVITESSECGKVYTNNPDIQGLYGNLLDGSENHLAAYVKNIEAVMGQGAYQAQVLSQEEVDSILGR
jgi:hypothetical protein